MLCRYSVDGNTIVDVVYDTSAAEAIRKSFYIVKFLDIDLTDVKKPMPLKAPNVISLWMKAETNNERESTS